MMPMGVAMISGGGRSLIKRCDQNPILTVADWPYRASAVFNPASIELDGGETLLLCRVETHDGFSHLA
ncbi:MAG: glycosidase, partial [Phycisphaerae bacterium]